MLESIALLAADQPSRSMIRPWFLALVYLALVGLCVWIWRRDRLRRPPGTSLWLGLAILLAALGVGKLFDAQAVLTNFLRREAIQEEWYHSRQPIQIGVIVASAAAVVFGVSMLVRAAARAGARRDLIPLAPVLLLLGFYAIRATSWHFIDAVLFRFVAGTRINTWAELTIEGLIALALLDQAARSRTDARLPRSKGGGEGEAVGPGIDGSRRGSI